MTDPVEAVTKIVPMVVSVPSTVHLASIENVRYVLTSFKAVVLNVIPRLIIQLTVSVMEPMKNGLVILQTSATHAQRGVQIASEV